MLARRHAGGAAITWKSRTAMLDLLRVRRARKAAVAAINPLVEGSRWRLHGIPDMVWLDPYVIGFLAMLITLVARREVRNLEGQALGLVQLYAWEDITRSGNANVGEEICLLSANGDAAFQTGCLDAERLFRVIEAGAADADAPDLDDEDPDLPAASVSALWSQYFDERVLATAATALEPG